MRAGPIRFRQLGLAQPAAFKSRPLQCCHVGQRAMFVVVVESVADDEHVGNFEAEIVRSQAASRRRSFHRRTAPRTLAGSAVSSCSKTAASVRPCRKCHRRPARAARGCREHTTGRAKVRPDCRLAAVARCLNHADAKRQLDRADQIGDEDHAPCQHADHRQRAISIFFGDLSAKFDDCGPGSRPLRSVVSRPPPISEEFDVQAGRNANPRGFGPPDSASPSFHAVPSASSPAASGTRASEQFRRSRACADRRRRRPPADR